MEEVEHRWKTVPPPCLPDEDKPIEERNKKEEEGASMPPAQLAPAVTDDGQHRPCGDEEKPEWDEDSLPCPVNGCY